MTSFEFKTLIIALIALFLQFISLGLQIKQNLNHNNNQEIAVKVQEINQ